MYGNGRTIDCGVQQAGGTGPESLGDLGGRGGWGEAPPTTNTSFRLPAPQDFASGNVPTIP
jgi:hypothetical protein